MNENIINAITPYKFLLEAYKSYSESAVENWSNFINIMSEIVNTSPFDEDGEDNMQNSMLHPGAQPNIWMPWIFNKLVEKNFAYQYDDDSTSNIVSMTARNVPGFISGKYSCTIQLENGEWITMFDFLYAFAYMNYSYISLGESDWQDQNIWLIIDPQNSQDHQQYSLYNMNEYINNTYSQIIGMSGAIKSAEAENAAERIAIFNDYVKQVYQNIYDPLNSGISYFREIISNVSSKASDVVNSLIDKVGILRQDDSSAPLNTNVGQYTGASPLGAINLNTTVGVYKAIGSGILSATKSLWKAATGLVSRAFNWCKKKIVQAYINPVDIYKVSDSEAYSCDGWAIPITPSNVRLSSSFAEGFKELGYNKIKGATFKMETIFGEVLYQFAEDMTYEEFDSQNNSKYSILFKPYCLNPDTVFNIMNKYPVTEGSSYPMMQYGNIANDYYVYTLGCPRKINGSPQLWGSFYWDISVPNALSAVNELKMNSELYLDVNDNEAQMYKGFKFAIALFNMYTQMAWLANENSQTTMIKSIFISRDVAASEINNRSFTMLLSGFNGDDSNPNFNFECIHEVGTSTSQTGHFITWETGLMSNPGVTLLDMLLFNQNSKIESPLSYTFLAYSKNYSNFRESRFALKTDAMNQKAANDFVNVIATIAIAIVLISIGVAASKKIIRHVAKRRLSYKLSVERALVNGEKVSDSMMKKYCRANRRLNATSYLVGNLQSSSGTSSTAVFGMPDDDQALLDSSKEIRNLLK